ISTSQTICSGSKPDTLRGATPGGGNNTYTYTWLKSSSSSGTFSAASGADSLQNYLSPVLTTTEWFKRLVVSGGCNDTSTAIQISVNPVIGNNILSGNQTICSGSNPSAITGSAPVGGNSSYTFSWLKSIVNSITGFDTVSGSSNIQNYFPPVLTDTTWYRRLVISGGCRDTSTAIQIIINSLIDSNTISGSQNICSGNTPAQFTGSNPSGSVGTYSYSWLVSTTGSSAGFSLAPGANTNKNYNPSSVSINSWFRRLVTSGSCKDTSSAVAVSITPAVTGNTIGSNQSIITGTTPATFVGSVPGGGNGTFSYLWLISTTNGNTGFSVASGTNNTQNYSPSAISVTTWYKRLVITGSCIDSSNDVGVSVNSTIANNVITSPPQSLCSGSTPATLIGATPTGGTGTFAYLWLKSTTSATTGFSPAPGTNNTQNYSPGPLTQTTWYSRTVVSGSSTDTSIAIAIAISISTPITGNTISGAQTICANKIPSAFNGSQPSGGNSSSYIYRWIKSITSSTGGFTNAGGNDSTQGYQSYSLATNTWFRRIVRSGSCASDTTSAILITVNPIIGSNTISGNQTVCRGSYVSQLTGALPSGGNGTYTYRWVNSTINASSGFDTATGTINQGNYSPLSVTSSTWFKRLVFSGSCIDSSSAVQVTVNPVIISNTANGNQTLCSGTLPSMINGSNPLGGNGTYNYLWLSSALSDSTGFDSASGINASSNYSPPSLTTTTWFKRIVSSGGCVDTSPVILITINPVLFASAAINSSSNTVCGGDTILFTATSINGGTSPFYQWKLNNSDVGTNSATYLLTAANSGDSIYLILTSNATPCLQNTNANSNGIKLNNSIVTPAVTVSTIGTSVCSGSPKVFNATGFNAGLNPVYQWKKNNVNVGSNSSTFVTSALSNNDTVSVMMTSSIKASCVTSSTATSGYVVVKVNTIPVINAQPVSVSVISGNNALFNISASGGLSYQWQQSNNGGISFTNLSNSSLYNGVNSDSLKIQNSSGLNKTKYRVFITDSCGGIYSDTVMLKINLRPIAVNDTVSTQSNIAVTFNPRANDFDVDSNLLNNPVIIVPPQHGIAVVNSNGNVLYSPSLNYTGPDTLLYRVCDNGTPSACDSAYVFIRVNYINNPPVARDTTYYILNNAVFSGTVKSLVTDPDNDLDITSFIATALPVKGTLSFNTNGSFSYTPLNNFIGSVSFIYKVCDLGTPTLCDTGIVYFIISNGYKIHAVNDSLSLEENTEITFDVRTNDVDSGSTIGNPSLLTQTQNGNLALNANGTITYKPAPDFIGTDSFFYKICDAGINSLCDSAQVLISVTRSLDDAVVVPQGFSPNGDGMNDLLVIKNIHKLPANKLTVINRWGQVVYEKQPYDNTWDGKANQGVLATEGTLPAGTYFYILETGTSEPAFTGYFYINK
ncbi:MAG: Ig-like domain-containing protein, partial [Bacteroidia bacterium]